jgi:hypothetical protein
MGKETRGWGSSLGMDMRQDAADDAAPSGRVCFHFIVS